MEQDQSGCKRLGPIRLSPGVEPWHVGVFLLTNTVTSTLIGYVTVVQPYILTQVLHIAVNQQGRLTGLLNAAHYGAVALLIVAAGSLADIVGRKPIVLMGMAGFVITLILLPFAASVAALFALRFFLGAASTGHTAGNTSMTVDFPTNETRGAFIAGAMIVQSIVSAVLVGMLFSRAPAFLVAHGFDPVAALRWSVWGLASLGAVVTVIAVFFLRVPPRPPGVQPRALSLKSILDTSREVLAHARIDPVFGLILLASFVIRSDFFVTQSFMSVWVMGASKLQGVDPPQALKTVGLCSMTWQLSAAVSPLFLGYIADRFSRMGMLIGSLAFAALAFTATLFVHRVDGIAILVVFGAIGAAEMAQTVSSQAAYGERAPPGLRGSGIGYFVLTGTISVVVISYLSGILFDKLGFIAPFLFLAFLNLLFVAAAIYFLLSRRGRAASAPTSA